MSLLFGSSGGSQQSASNQTQNMSSQSQQTLLQNLLQEMSSLSQQSSTNQQNQTNQTQQNQQTALSKILGTGLSPTLQKNLLSALGIETPGATNATTTGLNTATGVLDSGGAASGATLNNLANLWKSNVNAGISNLDTQTFGPQGLEAQINNQMADRGMGNSSAAVQEAQSVTPYYENALSQILNNANTNYYNASLSEPLALANLGLQTTGTGYGLQSGTLGTLLSSDIASGGQTGTAATTGTGATQSTGNSQSTGSTTSTNKQSTSSTGKTTSSSQGTASGSSSGSSSQSGFNIGLSGSASNAAGTLGLGG